MAAKKKPKKSPKKRTRARAPRAAVAAAAPTVVQLRFENGRAPTMAKGKKKLHGAALAAHNRAKGKGGGRKSNPASNPASNPRGRRRRRRNGTTFVQAVGKVLGATAAMFGSGVLVTLGTAKIAPGNKLSMYGIPLAAAALGAGIATRYPLVGAGVAAGGAAPFVLPVASRMLQPAAAATTTPAATASAVSGLRAVAMGGSYRALNHMQAVRMGAVQMGRQLHAT